MDECFWEKYKAVIFDCDDTILATMKTRWGSLIETASLFQRNLDEQTIRRFWGLPFDQLIANLVPWVDLQQFKQQYQKIMSRMAPEATPGARYLLDYLAGRDIRMAIVTSSARSLIIQDLRSLGMERYFLDVWGFEQTDPYFKPDPRVFERVLIVLTSLHLSLPDLLYIGDSVRDWRVAIGNSIDFIAVTSGLESRETFVQAGMSSDRIVMSLADLVPHRTIA